MLVNNYFQLLNMIHRSIKNEWVKLLIGLWRWGPLVQMNLQIQTAYEELIHWYSEATCHAKPTHTLHFLVWFDVLLIQLARLSPKRTKDNATNIIITRAGIQKLEIPTVYFLLFVTTEMLKHFEHWKKLDDIITCFSIFFLFFFFICLAITTDDIARHWESSCKAWETAMTNQVMRHGVTRRKGTLMALPLLHTRAHTLRHSRMRTHTCTENRKKHCESRKRSKGRGQGWQEHKADESNEISFFKSKCKMNYWRYLFMSTTTNMLVYQNPSSIFEYEQLEDNTPLRVRKLVLQRKRSRWLS